MLERAAKASLNGDRPVRVLNVRLPDFWGPNVLNAGMAPIFEGALNGKALPWLLNVDIPHQSVYTNDAAEIIVRLMLRDASASTTDPYEVWNYGGTTLPSMRWLFERISAVTGKPLKVQIYSRFIISTLGLFMPIMREVKEMLYLYENTILLDDSKVRAAFPDFQETPINQVLTETLAWFAKHQLKRPFTPVPAASTPTTTA
jgi:nucleoside-diphosphate-sugar epimerase